MILYRYEISDKGTKGVLKTNSGVKVCEMLELPYIDNKQGISCIPAGKYKVVFLKSSASGKYKNCYHILNVENRTGILIHKGNFAGNTAKGYKTNSLGCLLPCKGFIDYKGQYMGISSGFALGKIHKATQRQGFDLEIREKE